MTLTYGWACMACDETGTGDTDTTDRQAERHTKATGHPTRSWALPAG